ncbi:MAG: aldehyde dehydrogenase family protein, partial [Candidatus Sulfotelmatobacter sp.]
MATTVMPQIQASVSEFVAKPRKMLIGGKWVDAVSGKTFKTYNPATGETLASVAEGDKADIDLAVKAARKAFESGPWPEMSPSDRGRLLWKLADLVDKHHEELAELETLDNGKPVFFSRIVDVPTVSDAFRYYAGWATKVEGTTIPISAPGAQYFAYTLREPVGVAGQIIPWNFPLIMASMKLGPA